MLERIFLTAAFVLQIAAAIWWASALNSTVVEQKALVAKSEASLQILITKVALLEHRVTVLEYASKPSRHTN